MTNKQLKKMAELALIRAIPNMMTGDIKPGRLKNLMDNMQKETDKDLISMPNPTKKELATMTEKINEFEKSTGWGRTPKHIGTLVSFCLGIVSSEGADFSPKIEKLLMDISDYYSRAGNMPYQSFWAGDLANRKWQALFGIVEDDGKDSLERIEEINSEVDRQKMFEEYLEKMY